VTKLLLLYFLFLSPFSGTACFVFQQISICLKV